ncbi:YceD family protein [Solitalea koreensis]|uniref:YceD family protein n=1 Tax=Solitalea koreensis TaxID=543615 RepID=UPI00115AADBE|nr:DUF177 domain-containing protein [Solitalea koreensis]
MKANKEYIIPFIGLTTGEHVFEYSVDEKFFNEYEYSLVKRGNLKVHLQLNKQENMLVLDFHIEGIIQASCDRCLSEYPLPVEVNEQQIYKITDGQPDDSGEIIMLNRSAYEIDIAPLVYEFVNLQVPIISVCDEKGSYCDEEMLATLKKMNAEQEENAGEEEIVDPRWAALKKLKEN